MPATRRARPTSVDRVRLPDGGVAGAPQDVGKRIGRFAVMPCADDQATCTDCAVSADYGLADVRNSKLPGRAQSGHSPAVRRFNCRRHHAGNSYQYSRSTSGPRPAGARLAFAPTAQERQRCRPAAQRGASSATARSLIAPGRLCATTINSGDASPSVASARIRANQLRPRLGKVGDVRSRRRACTDRRRRRSVAAELHALAPHVSRIAASRSRISRCSAAASFAARIAARKS